MALVDTKFANSQVDTLRVTLLKIGGVVIRKRRWIKIKLTNAYPHPEILTSSQKHLTQANLFRILPQHIKNNGGLGLLCSEMRYCSIS
ncbi:transposase [Teredinibacter turnerae]|uniref:transposase n=1 Tax=Teredinibacter turnerae TaxID=2426 RepID=UPI000400B640